MGSQSQVKFLIAGVLTLACLLPWPGSAVAQGHTGDLFGDVIHIKRDAVTGQPILQKRWVELPGDTFGWGYCPIPVDAAGAEIPFAPLSCDVDPTELERVVEVDYFGRLSAGRSKERNQRTHFDEVIVSIKNAEIVDVDEAGRVKIGATCNVNGECARWKTIDSPMENLAVYNRLLKYGHIQTDPLEEDTSSGGSPEEGIVYHPALADEDWAKFRGVTLTMLPRNAGNQCFSGNTFVAECANPQSLTVPDFIMVSSFLGGSADKTGKITPDLVQYLNRFMKIPIATAETQAPVDTLPALIRDENGVIAPATSDLPFPANERFINWATVSYLRTDWFSRSLLALQTTDNGLRWSPTVVQLLQWLTYANGPSLATLAVMPGFVAAANDALRVVQFIHEYEIPANLWGGGAQTRTIAHGVTVPYRASDQTLQLSATVSATTPVNGGTVTFAVQTAQSENVGTAVTSGPIVNGAATASYTLPGGTLPQTLMIVAVYTGTAEFAASSGNGTVLIGLAATNTRLDAAMMPLSSVPYAVRLTARLGWADSVPIGEGTVSFTVRDGAGVSVGTPVSFAVASGVATADYEIPGGLAAQRLTVTGEYSGTDRFAESTGTNVLSVGCLTITIMPFSMPKGVVGDQFAVAFTTDGVPPTTLAVTGALPPGLSLTSALLAGVPAISGDVDITITATDAASCTGSRTYSLRVDPSRNILATGSGAGVPGIVRYFEPNGIQVPNWEFAPFTPGWTNGVRVALGDLTNDGVPDTVVGAGPGGLPLVNAYDGATHALIASVTVFEPTYTGGVNVALGDINGDGYSDLIVGASAGNPRVRIFNGRTGAVIFEFVAFAGGSGVQVAAGDVNGDGLADLVVGAGEGADPVVRVFDAATSTLLHEFYAYPVTFRGGVFVAAADLTADGKADIVVGPGSGGAPLVRALNGVTLAEIRAFLAFEQTFTGGVRVAASDLTGDGHAEIVVSAGPGGAPIVRILHGTDNAELSSFLAYPLGVTSGVYVAAPTWPRQITSDLPMADRTSR